MIFDDHARTILTENMVGDVDYRWTCNPYRGCAFACAACYARGSHEYLDLNPAEDFDQKIVVKRNAPELLRAAFDRPSWRGDTITFSSVTDPYQPAEKELELTRRCLEVCVAYQNPVRIVTKSPLVARDLDLLKQVRSHVDVSIAFTEDSPLEPGAPPIAERFALIRALDISVGVMAAPIICGVNDRQLVEILERAAAAGATTATWALLRLPEPTATVFADRLRFAMPRTAESILDRARSTRGAEEPREKPFHTRGEGGGAYVAAIEAMFTATTKRLGLQARKFAKPIEPPTTFRRPGQLSLF